MSTDIDQQVVSLLREIRDGQRELVAALSAQQARAEEQIRVSRANMTESIELQRIGIARQRTITLIAVPGILACIAAIAYLVFTYF